MPTFDQVKQAFREALRAYSVLVVILVVLLGSPPGLLGRCDKIVSAITNLAFVDPFPALLSSDGAADLRRANPFLADAPALLDA